MGHELKIHGFAHTNQTGREQTIENAAEAVYSKKDRIEMRIPQKV